MNTFQKEIYEECKDKKKFGLSLPVGSGKTLISLSLALSKIKNEDDKILIIAAKSLIESWKIEINKFLKEIYQIILTAKTVINNDAKIYITTPGIALNLYKLDNIKQKFINSRIENQGWGLPIEINDFIIPKEPYSKNDNNFIYNKKFKVLIVDEAQNYTNIKTGCSQAISSIYSKYRYLLSGTMFPETNVEKILGYHLLLHWNDFPINIPDTKIFINSDEFKGLNQTLVCRFFPGFKLPEIMKKILKIINRKVNSYRLNNRVEDARRYSSYLLAMISILRQSLISPLIPISKIFLDMLDYENKSEMSLLIKKELENTNLDYYLNDVTNCLSSKIKKIVEIVDKHKNEKLLLFSSFRTSIDLIKYFLSDEYRNDDENFDEKYLLQRQCFILESNQSAKKRGDIVQEFQDSENGILLLSYKLGSEGLNLQSTSTVLLTDFWWNSATSEQAIGRTLRYGQKSSIVNVYYFVSNTGIEKAIFQKQNDKKQVINELMDGPKKTNIQKISTKEIIRIINMEEIEDSCKDLF